MVARSSSLRPSTFLNSEGKGEKKTSGTKG